MNNYPRLLLSIACYNCFLYFYYISMSLIFIEHLLLVNFLYYLLFSSFHLCHYLKIFSNEFSFDLINLFSLLLPLHHNHPLYFFVFIDFIADSFYCFMRIDLYFFVDWVLRTCLFPQVNLSAILLHLHPCLCN